MRVLIILLAFTVTAAAQEQKLKFEFTSAQMEIIGAGLMELPGKIGNPVWIELKRQYDEQKKLPAPEKKK